MAGTARSVVTPSAAGRTWLGGAGVLVVAASLGWLAGPPGLLLGGAIAVLWFFVIGPFVIAAGHLGALLVLPATLDLTPLVALEAGFLAVLAAPAVRRRDWRPTLAFTVVLAVVLGSLAFGPWHPRWLVGLALVLAVAVGLYASHRYAVVVTELQGAEVNQ